MSMNFLPRVLSEVEIRDLGLCQLLEILFGLRRQDLDSFQIVQLDLGLEVLDEATDAELLPPVPQLVDVVDVLHLEDVVDGVVEVTAADDVT